MTKPPKKSRAAETTEAPKPKPAAKKINLGLQGGGAHGAFTWGVLDHLLSDDRIDIEGISGTSAGAMNAVMLADGLARGEPRRQPVRSRAHRHRPALSIHAL